MVAHPETAEPSSSPAAGCDDLDDPPVAYITHDPKTGRAYPEPTSPEPSFITLAGQLIQGTAVCTDGCFGLEPDGICEHGHPTWLRRFGVV